MTINKKNINELAEEFIKEASMPSTGLSATIVTEFTDFLISKLDNDFYGKSIADEARPYQDKKNKEDNAKLDTEGEECEHGDKAEQMSKFNGAHYLCPNGFPKEECNHNGHDAFNCGTFCKLEKCVCNCHQPPSQPIEKLKDTLTFNKDIAEKINEIIKVLNRLTNQTT